jgi:hypothetical protein
MVVRAQHTSEQLTGESEEPKVTGSADGESTTKVKESCDSDKVTYGGTNAAAKGSFGSARLVRDYTYEHVLPNEVDVQKVTCKFQTDGTLLIQAPILEALRTQTEVAKEIPIKRE